MGAQTIRVQHALLRYEQLITARAAAEAVWRANGMQSEYYKWRSLARKAARQRAKIARAFMKLV